MKKSIILIVFLLIGFYSIAQTKKILVYYFHASQRCPTCLAVENNTKKILGEVYKNEIENGIIIFKTLNKDDEQNNTLVQKYKVIFNSLIIIKMDGTKETMIDLSDKAFQYAKNNPEKFKQIFKTELDKILK